MLGLRRCSGGTRRRRAWQVLRIYRPYRVNSVDSPLVSLNQKATNIIVTVGFPF
jgi:hypothetical protein